MEMQYQSFKFEYKLDANKEGAFSGYGSIFGNIDSANEIVSAGAFADSIKQYANSNVNLPVLWQHKYDSPIGVYRKFTEDSIGLRVEGEINLEVQQGREAYALLKQGAISGLSIGYSVEQYEMDNQSNIRILKALNLYEVSLVTFPANDRARVTDVKSIYTVRDLEKFLRDAGLSRGEALGVASRFKAKENQSDSVCAGLLNQKIDTLLTALNRG